MVCDRQINLNIAADAALRQFMAGTFRVKQFVKSHVLAGKLYAHIWLLKTYAIPASMYATQIWSTTDDHPLLPASVTTELQLLINLVLPS